MAMALWIVACWLWEARLTVFSDTCGPLLAEVGLSGQVWTDEPSEAKAFLKSPAVTGMLGPGVAVGPPGRPQPCPLRPLQYAHRHLPLRAHLLALWQSESEHGTGGSYLIPRRGPGPSRALHSGARAGCAGWSGRVAAPAAAMPAPVPSSRHEHQWTRDLGQREHAYGPQHSLQPCICRFGSRWGQGKGIPGTT